MLRVLCGYAIRIFGNDANCPRTDSKSRVLGVTGVELREPVSWLSARAPFNGRLIEAECLNHKRGRFVEVLYRCAGPISCRASGSVAIAAQCNPFSTSQYVADTDRFLGI